jgi:hypothetical protein
VAARLPLAPCCLLPIPAACAAPAALHNCPHALLLPLQVETRATGVEREVAEGRHVEHLGTTVSLSCLPAVLATASLATAVLASAAAGV